MTALTLELPPELYARLRAEAERLGRYAEEIAQDWLAERLEEAHPATPAMGGRYPLLR
jgi:predicted transcriptional regulator